MPPSPSQLLEPDAVETPAALVDLDRSRCNAERVATYLRERGLRWRPHVKTHKSRTLARLQLRAGASGLTVATLREAEAMADLETELLLAHPPVDGSRARRLALLLERTPVTVALDSGESLEAVHRAARSAGREVPVLVEIDVGMRRTGVVSAHDAARLAKRAATQEGTRFEGILFYPGHIRSPTGQQEQAIAALGETVSRTVDALEAADLPPKVVSGGSTPTLWNSHRIPGLTEVRAGTCIFYDRDGIALGVCAPHEIAYVVLATVISTAVPGQAVVDAGSKALAREEFRAGKGGYGLVEGHPDVEVRALSEEHGILDLGGSSWRPAVGDRVEIVPNHVCVSVNLQDRLLAREPGGLRPLELEGRGRLRSAAA